MYAAIITGALYSGIILNDLIQQAPSREILKHFLFGVISVSIMVALILNNMGIVAWGLLLIPTMVLLSVFFYILWKPAEPPVVPPPAPAPAPKPKKKKASPKSYINLPDTENRITICDDLIIESPPPEKPQCIILEDGTIKAPEPPVPESKPCPVPDTTKPLCPPKGAGPGGTSAEANQQIVATSSGLSSLANAVKSNLTPVTAKCS